ncbi:hypothetical protein [Paenibacillus sp. LjRoot56]|uniref:hypothetical protein n=1 Tax=Paenibacillus sp. LjRoot56 TaxID=3342333 RepID=UPI003ED0679E
MGVKIATGNVENTCSIWNELGNSTTPLFPHAYLTKRHNTYHYLFFHHRYLVDEILRIDELA